LPGYELDFQFLYSPIGQICFGFEVVGFGKWIKLETIRFWLSLS